MKIMNICTKIFGEIGIEEDKIITFPNGIIGFPDLKKFLLIHDEEKTDGKISWLQSIDEPAFAMTVINPLDVLDSYNPVVEDELLSSLGDLDEQEMLVLITITIPQDITKMTVNMAAPIVVNAKNKKAVQIIIEEAGYKVKYPIYDILKSRKAEK
jgi:flagellar assembly factor FliW